MLIMSALRFFLPILLAARLCRAYVPPEALVEPLKPAGIRISIPDESGISLVAFHVKFNDEFNGLEAGTIARDIVSPKNGRWTYEDRSTRVKENDVVHYWVHVVYDGLGYNLINQQHTVTDFYDYKGEKIESSSGDSDVGGSGKQPCERSTTRLFDPTSGASRRPCAGQLLFKEDFRDLAQLRRMQWTVVEQFSNSPDYEFVVYRDSRENVNVENGLRITPKLLKDEYGEDFVRKGNLTLDKCTGLLGSHDCWREARGWNILPPVTSGRINTKKSINLEYGRIEIRAKFPRGDWIYPLLLLEPARNFEGSSLETLQIRIASSSGNPELKFSSDGSDISGHMLWGGVTNLIYENPEDHVNLDRATTYNRELWSDDFHVYELIWSLDRIILMVDGEKYDDQRVDFPDDLPFYLTLGVAVGGLSEFPDNSISLGYTKPWRNVEAKALYNFYAKIDTWQKTWQDGATSLDVDYVKIWAL